MRITIAFVSVLLATLCAFGLAGSSVASAPAGGLEIKWNAPTSRLAGAAFNVHIELTAPAGGTVVSGWLLTPAAFVVDGKAIAEREDKGSMSLPEGAKITANLDLGPYLKSEKDFQIVYASGIGDDKPVSVKMLMPCVPGLNFMDGKSVPLDDLAKYNVMLQTNRGDMIVEFWPDVAPNHVRNFLDLSYTNFYSGTTFHRVIRGFMIQGGDPTGTGGGNGPRKLAAEFNAKHHERGVLSMARVDDPNSASCQFFIMHGQNPGLDGKYSAFGKLIGGYDTLDLIATTPTSSDRPLDPVKIVKATVILATPK